MKGMVFASLPLIGGGLFALSAFPFPESKDNELPERVVIEGLDSRNAVAAQEPEFTVPDGFAVEEVYSPEQAGTVVALTFDSRGDLVIAREEGPIVTLYDTDEDGKFDREVQFSEEVGTSQGIFFDGPNLLVAGHGPEGVGLYRVIDGNGDSRGEQVELIEHAWGSIGDHGPHTVFFGPDGYLYWTQGNGSGIFEAFHPASPLRQYTEGSLNGRCDPRGHACEWRAPGGKFLRTPYTAHAAEGETTPLPSNTVWELHAAGFRNQYDGAFNMLGELFTFDSDMEWDRELPWYKGTSSVHVLAGGDHGWRSGSMNHPWHYSDILSPMEDLGRGSPTGVEVLHTYSYPAEYWDVVLQADWSRGRIVAGRLEKDGSTYSQSQSNFVYAEPLNVTDLSVGPDGNLYFALGGRNTTGGIYRVVYNGPGAMERPNAETWLEQVLTMPQPRSAYSRELARAAKAEAGEAWGAELVETVSDAQQPAERRARALELLQVYGPAPDAELLASLRDDATWEVRSAAAYYLGLRATDSARRELVAMTKDEDPFVQRRALEALLRTGIHPLMEPGFSPVDDILPLLSSPERFVRYQARHVLYETPRALWEQEALALEGHPASAEGLLAFVETLKRHNPLITDVSRALARGVELLEGDPSDEELVTLIRPIQRAMLEDHGVTSHRLDQASPPVEEPYDIERYGRPAADGTPAPLEEEQADRRGGSGGGQERNEAYEVIGETLLERFPSGDTLLDRELVRTMAYLDTPGAIEKISMELEDVESPRTQQIFYADQLGFMRSDWDDASVDRLAGWLGRVYTEQWRGGASFVLYIDYTRDALLDDIVRPDMHASIAQRLEEAQPQVAAGPGQGGWATGLIDEELFELLVYDPGSMDGDVALGVAAMEKAGCAACHGFGPVGIEFGPDLTTAGQRYTRHDLVRKIMFPHESVGDQYPAEEITTTDGRTLVGIVVGEDGPNLRLQLNGLSVVDIPRTDIASRTPSDRSVMPDGLLSALSGEEREALIALLLEGPRAIPDSTLARIGADR